MRRWRAQNKERIAASNRKYREKNRETCAAADREKRQQRPELYRALRRRWATANPDKVAVLRARQALARPGAAAARAAKWNLAHPEVMNAKTARRRAAKRRATPAWANQAEIKKLYEIAARRTRLTGFEWHVDHIVPLRHPLVQGLHVENNLQVMPAKWNLAKGNRHWPDMPGATP